MRPSSLLHSVLTIHVMGTVTAIAVSTIGMIFATGQGLSVRLSAPHAPLIAHHSHSIEHR
jgi:hypothetical protein